VSPQSGFLVLGLLATAAAIGLSPYSAIAAAGLVGHLGLVTLPTNLVGLAAPAVWGTLIGLSAIDGLISRYRTPDLVWNALHTLAKPLAAALYASASVAAAVSSGTQWAVAAGSLSIALAVHLTVLSVRTAAHTAGPISWLPGLTLLRLLAASLFAVIALVAPPVAASIAAVLVFAPLLGWTRLWGAASLTLRSVFTWLTRLDRLHTWEPAATSLHSKARRAVESELRGPIGSARSAAATLARLGPFWTYRRGRLIITPDKPPVFVTNHPVRPSVIPLAPGRGQPDHRALIETVEIDARVPYVFCIGPDAPPGTAILAELARSGERGGLAEPGGGGRG
jgi:hypothetical protein